MIIHKLKKAAAVLFAVFGLFNNTEATQAKAKKVLIVYFSHTNNTECIANKINDKLAENNEVKLCRIEPTSTYPDYGEELRELASKEAKDDSCKPAFKQLNVDVQEYDMILVGTPVWWYKAPKVVVSFLEKQDFSGKEVRFFITHGGGPGDCISDMQNACKGANFGTNIDVYCDVPHKTDVDTEQVGEWADKLFQS